MMRPAHPPRGTALVITIKHISMDHPLYHQAVDLRTRILLKPLGYSIEDYKNMSPGREEQCEHFVATIDHPTGELVIGAATLFPPNSESEEAAGKVQQVCVDRQRQGEGIGTKLMIAIEARAFSQLNLPGLYCHAQVPVVLFYEKLGWDTGSEIFEEAGIDHKRMQILAPKPSELAE